MPRDFLLMLQEKWQQSRVSRRGPWADSRYCARFEPFFSKSGNKDWVICSIFHLHHLETWHTHMLHLCVCFVRLRVLCYGRTRCSEYVIFFRRITRITENETRTSTQVLMTGYRPNMYSRPARVFRILFHPRNMGIYALYILSAVFAFYEFPYRPEMDTSIYRDGVLAGLVKYASSTRQEAFVIRFPRLERGRILQVWERLPLVFQNSFIDTLTTFVLMLIFDWMMNYSDTTTMWHLRALLLLFTSWHVAQHVLEIFLTTPMRRMTLEHAVAAIAVRTIRAWCSSVMFEREARECQFVSLAHGISLEIISIERFHFF